jgi:two-component system sensor histidine kinase RpfC
VLDLNKQNKRLIAIIDDPMMDISVGAFTELLHKTVPKERLSLILYNSSSRQIAVDEYLNSGFSAVLQQPLDKTLLYNALHAAVSSHHMLENIVPLADYYRQRATRSLYILVAEDNKINQLVIKQVLEKAGHTVVLAEDGEQALDMLERDTFEMLILDMNMPKVSGVDVAKAYKFMRPRSKAPVILLTADATPEAKRACYEAGADRYLTKPLEPKRLLWIIAELAEKRPNVVSIEGSANSSDIAILDISIIEKLLGMNVPQSFFDDLLESFKSNGRSNISTIGKALDEKDYPRFREAVHALKGSAGDLGATALLMLCKEAERLKPYDLPAASREKWVGRFETIFEQTSGLLFKHLTHKTHETNKSL